MLLGGLLEQQAKNPKLTPAERQDNLNKAVAQYKTASEVARHDVSAHQQILAKFKALNQPELAAVETQRVAESQKIEAALKAREGTKGAARPGTAVPTRAPASSTAPAPAPEKSKSGG